MKNSYKLDGKIFVPDKGSMKFNYSDGEETERKIYNIVKSVKEPSIYNNELRTHIEDWPTEYHFSPLRHNLLRPFHFSPSEKVLEIGAGCGAITRQLGESGADVVALEGSYQRAQITAERCRDLNNVQVCCDNFANFTWHHKFNVATLIGVLEYAPCFVEHSDPVHCVLEMVKDQLVDNGLLIIAIENQLGLKYFNGAPEDHTGRIFDGINDLYRNKSAITFGKEELKRKLIRAGYSDLEFLYPFPDYKLPRLILKEEALLNSQFHTGQIIAQYKSKDYFNQNNRLFQEDLCWPLLERNKLISELANSFLVIAKKGNNNPNNFTGNWLAKTYSVSRRVEYWTETTFYSNNNDISVEKTKIFKEKNSSQEGAFKQNLFKSDFVQGQHYNLRLGEIFSSANPQMEFIKFLEPWVKYLRLKADQFSDSGKLLPGHYIDCMPQNLIFNSNEGYVYIDVEWEYKCDLSLDFVFIRGIVNLISSFTVQEQKYLLNQIRPIDYVLEIAKYFNINLDEDGVIKFLELEGELHEQVYASTKAEYLLNSKKWIYSSFIDSYKIVDLLDERNSNLISVDNQVPIIQVYCSEKEDYSEENSNYQIIKTDGQFHIYEFVLNMDPLMKLRIDPTDIYSYVQIKNIVISYQQSSKPVLRYNAENGYSGLNILSGIVPVEINSLFSFVTLNTDPQLEILLPELPLVGEVLTLKVEMSVQKTVSEELGISIQNNIESLKNTNFEDQKMILKLCDEVKEGISKYLNLKSRCEELESSMSILEQKYSEKVNDLLLLENKYETLTRLNEGLQQKIIDTVFNNNFNKINLEIYKAAFNDINEKYNKIMRSRTWKILNKSLEVMRKLLRREEV